MGGSEKGGNRGGNRGRKNPHKMETAARKAIDDLFVNSIPAIAAIVEGPPLGYSLKVRPDPVNGYYRAEVLFKTNLNRVTTKWPVAPFKWSVGYRPWGEDEYVSLQTGDGRMTVLGIDRCDKTVRFDLWISEKGDPMMSDAVIGDMHSPLDPDVFIQAIWLLVKAQNA